jgi:proteasome lid subunit RPN8/RPN11
VSLHERRTGGLVIPEPLLAELARHVGEVHPEEAGGYLACERRGGLVAVDRVALVNESDQPRRRFETTAAQAPPIPRVFYHSHTSARSPSGLTRLDRKLDEQYVLVVFAPRGEPFSYRLFCRGVFGWGELPVRAGPATGATAEPLPRLL